MEWFSTILPRFAVERPGECDWTPLATAPRGMRGDAVADRAMPLPASSGGKTGGKPGTEGSGPRGLLPSPVEAFLVDPTGNELVFRSPAAGVACCPVANVEESESTGGTATPPSTTRRLGFRGAVSADAIARATSSLWELEMSRAGLAGKAMA